MRFSGSCLILKRFSYFSRERLLGIRKETSDFVVGVLLKLKVLS